MYVPLRDTLSADLRPMREWGIEYDNRLLGTQTVRAKARKSVVIEVFQAQREDFIAQLKLTAGLSGTQHWIAHMLPAEVLTLDPSKWRAPTQFELFHLVGTGSFTGVSGEKCAHLIGVTPQNLRKYIQRPGVAWAQRISFASWHLLLHRLGVQPLPLASIE